MTMGRVGGIGLLVVAVALWRVVDGATAGVLPRNGQSDIRTAATTASDEAWVRGHAAAVAPARRVADSCGTLAAVMMVASVAHGTADPDALTIGLFALGYAVAVVGCVWIATVADRGARSTQR